MDTSEFLKLDLIFSGHVGKLAPTFLSCPRLCLHALMLKTHQYGARRNDAECSDALRNSPLWKKSTCDGQIRSPKLTRDVYDHLLHAVGDSPTVSNDQQERFEAADRRALEIPRSVAADSARHNSNADTILNEIECFGRRTRFGRDLRLEAHSRALGKEPLLKNGVCAIGAWHDQRVHS
jgi:hypothetical protein